MTMVGEGFGVSLSRDSDAAQTLRHSHANARRGSRPRAVA
jgi:hypothetical protein